MIFLDKLKDIFRVNRKIFVFLLGILILGVLFGSILPVFLSVDDKRLVSEYLSGFVFDIKNIINSIVFLKNGLLSDGVFLILIWLMGVSIIGVPVVLFLFFYRCFVFGFSISAIVMNYGFKGILFSFVYIFPHNVISIISYIVMSVYSLIFSIKLLFFILRKIDFNIRVFFKKYLYIFFICFFVVCLSILYESFVNPHVLRFAFKLLGL